MTPTAPTPPAPECLPPDPSVPGLWWVRHTNGHWEVWVWLGVTREWCEPGAYTSPAEAAAAGWHVHSRAIPPQVTP